MFEVRKDGRSVVMGNKIAMSMRPVDCVGLNLLHLREISIEKRRRRSSDALHAQLPLNPVGANKQDEDGVAEINDEPNQSQKKQRRQDSQGKRRLHPPPLPFLLFVSYYDYTIYLLYDGSATCYIIHTYRQ